MDLTEILRKRTAADLEVAMARSLELSLEINEAGHTLKTLRDELNVLEKGSSVVPATEDRVWTNAPSADLPPSRVRPAAPASGAGRETSGGSSSPSAAARILKLFSGKRAEPVQFRWHLDEVAGTFPVRDKDGIDMTVSSTGFPTLTLSGWIVPMDGGQAFAGIEIELIGSDRSVVRQTPTYPRPDVADHFGDPAFSSCGFRFELPSYEVPAGRYALRIATRGGDGARMSTQAGSITIA